MIPKMILFDYGQTLFNQQPYNSRNGYEAVMKQITGNPQNVSAETVTALASKIYKNCGDILGYKKKKDWHLEVPQTQIIHYIMEFYGLKSDCSLEKLSVVYWDAASNGTAVQHVDKMLKYLHNSGIRTGVVSNLAFSEDALRARLQRAIPGHEFEFIISSNDVIFRKPEAAIFELAVAKSGLKPEEIWYCGDDTIWDIESSNAVGITPVWFVGALDYEQRGPDCDHIIVHDWLEMIDLLKRMNAKK